MNKHRCWCEDWETDSIGATRGRLIEDARHHAWAEGHAQGKADERARLAAILDSSGWQDK